MWYWVFWKKSSIKSYKRSDFPSWFWLYLSSWINRNLKYLTILFFRDCCKFESFPAIVALFPQSGIFICIPLAGRRLSLGWLSIMRSSMMESLATSTEIERCFLALLAASMTTIAGAEWSSFLPEEEPEKKLNRIFHCGSSMMLALVFVDRTILYPAFFYPVIFAIR